MPANSTTAPALGLLTLFMAVVGSRRSYVSSTCMSASINDLAVADGSIS